MATHAKTAQSGSPAERRIEKLCAEIDRHVLDVEIVVLRLEKRLDALEKRMAGKAPAARASDGASAEDVLAAVEARLGKIEKRNRRFGYQRG